MLKRIYRYLQSKWVKPLILNRFFSSTRIAESFENQFDWKSEDFDPYRSEKFRFNRIWFHAASVGELESIWPLIQLISTKNAEVILTVFSESAKNSVMRLKKALEAQSTRVIFCGYSPWEGSWDKALRSLKPDLFVTAKYEAWPDLWMSLSERNIPLAIVSAHARKSFRIAKLLCNWMGGRLPRMILFSCLDSEQKNLESLFPSASLVTVGEPRWDRVFDRAKAGNSRAQELILKLSYLERPWGVVGSAWIKDLEFLKPILTGRSFSTLWVVPHLVDSSHIQEIQTFLEQAGLTVLKTSGIYKDTNLSKIQVKCILVDEIGFLSELYSTADWAFVGGGFGAGIHSTIEPAIHGIPIGVGPNGTQKFSEVQELLSTGQLQILDRVEALTDWADSLQQKCTLKLKWTHDAKRRLGATQKILTSLENFK